MCNSVSYTHLCYREGGLQFLYIGCLAHGHVLPTQTIIQTRPYQRREAFVMLMLLHVFFLLKYYQIGYRQEVIAHLFKLVVHEPRYLCLQYSTSDWIFLQEEYFAKSIVKEKI